MVFTNSDIEKKVNEKVPCIVVGWLDKLCGEKEFEAEKITGFMYPLALDCLGEDKPCGPMAGKVMLTYMKKHYVISYEYKSGPFIHLLGKMGIPGGGQDEQ